ncbi:MULTISPECIES: sugar ABC transporter substrate-binding protein [Rhizobium]|uniref:Simple sugar transport system substrate-binding protein n=1 Tax=Rhizobium favelukesii TaxID=348824 RepID=W6RHM0_9HYPH|nr:MULTISPECIES: sugar ABC transporter substrate-binding protein [Rhizobium]MCA0802295.1 sugar ABC transporter substrate-binding protein [Rhizobium sp. T1473]MCS0462618.1 sugar ABC transporter substrate-binding protein [Rhizobium favelukesii]UFS84075.1 sugar ABC transporter substrate-binding protein [Rhizobium sp. T136]CDM58268.1 simple sugar transport system substrate-binding protein [Rhizobium favelukesii]
MLKFLSASALALVLSTQTHAAERIGVSMGTLSNNFQTLIVNGMDAYAKSIGVELQIEDATTDVNKQLDQVRNFATSGVSAIIVDPVDSDGTPALSKVAEEAGIPLIYVNVQPTDLSTLGKQQAFVGSNEIESGTLQTKEVCRMLGGKGNVVIMIGDLTSQAARQRTQDVHDVIKTPECSGLKVVQEQVGSWSRVNGADLVSNWLTSGLEFDAVIANNDEMALGAIAALKNSGASTDKILVAGIDATPEALQAMKAGDLKVTVFQDAKGQGKGSIDAAVKAARGEKLDREVWIPFQLVTQRNMAQFENLN